MSNIVNLRPDLVKQQIAKLRSQFPELEADEEDWLLALESETELDGVLASLLSRLHEVEALSGGLEGKIAEFKVRADRFKLQQERLRACMLSLMEAAGLQKKETPTATLSIRQGVDRVVVNDEASVPDLFMRIKREPNLTRIKEHLKDGASLNWASLVKGDNSLSIRKA